MNRDFTGTAGFTSNIPEDNSRSVLIAKFLCPLSSIGGDFATGDEDISLLSGFR